MASDHQEMTRRATQIIDGVETLYVTDVVIAEVGFVLTSIYQLPRQIVVDYLIALLQKNNIDVFGFDKATALQALLLCRPSNRVSFADAMLWAAARSATDGVICTFDKRFPDDGIELIEP
jgi:predicted nucleic acid-binding protein